MVQEKLVGDEVAVITGGASGFGLALAENCAKRGIRSVLMDRDEHRAKDEAARLAAEYGLETFGVGVDVADEEAVAAAASFVQSTLGRADLVVSNVGVQLLGSIERLTDEEWRWVLDINVTGSARVARHFLPLLRSAPRGRLAFTTSSSVIDPASRLAAYQASKFAVWGLAETLRVELADEGIRVSVIFPSGMMSRHFESSAEAQPEHLRRPVGDEQDIAAMMNSNPEMAQQIASPADIASRVLDALLAGERYVITHGDLVGAISSRGEDLKRAADAARSVVEKT